jgi:hypothetical protein
MQTIQKQNLNPQLKILIVVVAVETAAQQQKESKQNSGF